MLHIILQLKKNQTPIHVSHHPVVLTVNVKFQTNKVFAHAYLSTEARLQIADQNVL